MRPAGDSLALLADPGVRASLAAELGVAIEYHPRLGSTQERARELAAAPGSGTHVVVADDQTAGQGTRGRVWLAAAGSSLLASWAFRPAPAEPALIALLAGVAVARALDAVGVPGATLEWPNDVLIRGRKIAGVLATGATVGGASMLVVGIGVNVHQREMPASLGGAATSAALEGPAPDRLALLAALTRELGRLAPAAERGAALAEWRRRAVFLGEPVEVDRPGQPPLAGTARDVDPDGALVVETAYGPERVFAGEVTVKGMSRR